MTAESKILKHIDRYGYITIDKFFEISMNDSEYGYYSKKNPIGEKSDFITAPEISQIFGETIATFLAHQIMENLKEYDNLQIVELGAGKGTLLDDVLRTFNKLKITSKKKIYVKIFDINEELIESQKNLLKNYDNYHLEWITSLENLDQKPTIFIANEFFDALPYKQFVFVDDTWYERAISIDENQNLYFSTAKQKNPDEKIANLLTNKPTEGKILEFSEASVTLMQKLIDQIKHHKGIIFMIDYGYLKTGFGDTLQSIYRHNYNSIFNKIGYSDLTFHVNFEILAQICFNNGLNNVFIQNQGDFLLNMGISLRLNKMLENLNKLKEKELLVESYNRLVAKKHMGELFKNMIIENY